MHAFPWAGPFGRPKRRDAWRYKMVGVLVVGLAAFVSSDRARGQTIVQAGPDGQIITVPGASPAAQAGTPAAQPGATGEQPAGAAGQQPASGEASGEKKEEKAAEGDSTVKRPSKPARVPDPRELDVVPDENHRLQFNFHGQLWPDVLQWLASIGGQSLDWRELPDDYIHVASHGKMSVPEVRELFNRLLFERGFTIVERNNVLMVLKLEGLDPALLRRVEDEAELLDLPAHEFVKITFSLPDKLKADKFAEDVKPLLTRWSKVQPLMATNRLLVVDTVGNLREVSRLVNTEHAAAVSQIVPREFPLRYARADQVADQVMILLGLDPSSRRTPQELQVEQQRLQLFQQMQQQGRDISKYLRGDDAPVVFLAVNDRNNSVIVNSPPHEMEIIERAIKLLDIPGGMLAAAGTQPLGMKRYSLVTIKPESVLTALKSIGDLDPRSQVSTDSEAKVIFANATPADHAKIQAMIDQLDGTGREFDVVWLRRLQAEAVAVTIRKLMVGEEKKDDNSRRPSYYYFGYSGNEEKDESPNKGFRIEADARQNRLLLWANADEMSEVRKLLVKLGEIPGESGNPHTVRAFHAGDEQAARELVERLRRLWPSIQSNPLEVDPLLPTDGPSPGAIQTAPPVESDNKEPRREARAPHVGSEPTGTAQGNSRDSETTTKLIDAHAQSLAWAAVESPDDAVAAEGPGELDDRAATAANAPQADASVALAPIQISVAPGGQVFLRSDDTRALDHLEELIDRVAPPRKDFEIFYLKHASASLVKINLEEYFEEDTKNGSDAEDAFWAGWYGYYPPSGSDDSTATSGGLAQRKPLRFIYDFDTNSILVSNATPEQISTIRSLIEIYDRPISEESISARRFQIFPLRHARATEVAATIKDVYRDLLSSKDKVFERNNEQKEQTSQSTNYIRVFGSSEDKEKKPTKVKASFAGAVSVGVDEATNTVIVSAQEEWMPSIAEMIRYLDVAAEPYEETVEVVSTNVNAKTLQAALSRVIKGGGGKDAKEGANQPATNQTPMPGANGPGNGKGNATTATTPATSE